MTPATKCSASAVRTAGAARAHDRRERTDDASRQPAGRSVRMNRGEIKALTSLRGIAAMAVVMQHFFRYCPDTVPNDDPLAGAAWLRRGGLLLCPERLHHVLHLSQFISSRDMAGTVGFSGQAGGAADAATFVCRVCHAGAHDTQRDVGRAQRFSWISCRSRGTSSPTC